MRTIEEIQGDYAKAATQLGDLTYRISVIEEDARSIRRAMRKLNQEAAAIKNAEHNKAVEEAKNEQQSEG